MNISAILKFTNSIINGRMLVEGFRNINDEYKLRKGKGTDRNTPYVKVYELYKKIQDNSDESVKNFILAKYRRKKAEALIANNPNKYVGKTISEIVPNVPNLDAAILALFPSHRLFIDRVDIYANKYTRETRLKYIDEFKKDVPVEETLERYETDILRSSFLYFAVPPKRASSNICYRV